MLAMYVLKFTATTLGYALHIKILGFFIYAHTPPTAIWQGKEVKEFAIDACIIFTVFMRHIFRSWTSLIEYLKPSKD